MRHYSVVPGAGAIAVEMAAEVGGALDVAVRGVELHAGELLQVGGLRVHEELVHGRDRHVADESEVYAHAQAGEQVHGLFAADRLRRAKYSVRPADAVVEGFLALADEEVARFTLVVDENRNNVGDLLR